MFAFDLFNSSFLTFYYFELYLCFWFLLDLLLSVAVFTSSSCRSRWFSGQRAHHLECLWKTKCELDWAASNQRSVFRFHMRSSGFWRIFVYLICGVFSSRATRKIRLPVFSFSASRRSTTSAVRVCRCGLIDIDNAAIFMLVRLGLSGRATLELQCVLPVFGCCDFF